MKYETVTKTERNKDIVRIHKEQKELSFAEIGAMFPVGGKPLSPQRIAQIIDKYSRRK